MDAGEGILDLGLALTKQGVGGKVDYQHRFNESIAGFVEGQAWYDWQRRQLEGQAMAGLRIRF